MKLLWIFFTFIMSWSVLSDDFIIEASELFKKMDFIPHEGYVAMNINFLPIKALKIAVEDHYEVSLIDRGEAHITLISPPEYDVLASKLSIEDLNAMVRRTIQEAQFVAQCVGRGQKIIEGRNQQTYFMVVTSSDLVELRRKIHRKFIALKGEEQAFTPDDYFPHITVGYTQRDLHASDGVRKDESACILSALVVE